MEIGWCRERESAAVLAIDGSYCTLDRIGVDRHSDSYPVNGSGLVDLYVG